MIRLPMTPLVAWENYVIQGPPPPTDDTTTRWKKRNIVGSAKQVSHNTACIVNIATSVCRTLIITACGSIHVWDMPTMDISIKYYGPRAACWSYTRLVCWGLSLTSFWMDPPRSRANAWFSANAWGAVVGVNLCFIVTNMISLSAVAQLLHFHIGLQKKNLTTYQFIVSDNARRREEFQKKEERKGLNERRQWQGHVKREIQSWRQDWNWGNIVVQRVMPCQWMREAAAPAVGADSLANGGAKHEPTAGYAELSDGDEPVDEKTSMTSDQDLVLMNATSLGGSSSSQLGSKEGIKPSTSSDNVTAENSNEEEAMGGDEDQEHANVMYNSCEWCSRRSY